MSAFARFNKSKQLEYRFGQAISKCRAKWCFIAPVIAFGSDRQRQGDHEFFLALLIINLFHHDQVGMLVMQVLFLLRGVPYDSSVMKKGYNTRP